MTAPINERAMVLNMTAGFWQGYRLDREASRKVTEDNNAAAGAARVNKHLIPKELLAPIQSAAGAARNHFYANTLPWRDNGDRLITRVLFPKFVEEHSKLVNEFNDQVTLFLDHKYREAVTAAATRMGALFDLSDYPPPSSLRSKFYISLDIDVITDVADFRVQLDQEHTDMVRASMESSIERRMAVASRDVWERIAKVVSYFSERMAADTGFRSSTLENLEELVELIPGINILDDPNIEAIRQQIKAKLTGLDAKSIKADTALRSQLAGDAKAIVDQMAPFMNAMSAAFGAE